MLLPTRIDSIMIAVDTSGSMQADDIAPSRIEAKRPLSSSSPLNPHR